MPTGIHEKQVFTRRCPECRSRITYSRNYTRKEAELKQRVCRECEDKRKLVYSKDAVWSRACPQCAKGIVYTRKDSYDYAQKRNSVCHSCNGKLPKKATAQTKQKCRLATIRYILSCKGQVSPRYSPAACRLIEAYGQQHGLHFQHAENGGEFHIKELGYFVDGYDAQQNIVIEVDEPHHYNNGKLRSQDVRRQREIERHLGCTFIRVKT